MRMSLVQAMAVAVPLTFGALGATVGLDPVFWSVGLCLAAGGIVTRRATLGSLQALRFNRSANALRNLATLGATTNMQYGWLPLRSK